MGFYCRQADPDRHREDEKSISIPRSQPHHPPLRRGAPWGAPLSHGHLRPRQHLLVAGKPGREPVLLSKPGPQSLWERALGSEHTALSKSEETRING